MAQLSSNIVLSASPSTSEMKYPDIYSDLLTLINAVKSLQSYLDIYTAARVIATASSAISRGRAVNLYSSGGSILCRPANATNNTKPCHGFALTDIDIGSAGEIQTIGLNQAITGLIPGTVYYLAITDGLLTATAPIAAGNLVQELGVALAPDSMLYRPAFNWKQL